MDLPPLAARQVIPGPTPALKSPSPQRRTTCGFGVAEPSRRTTFRAGRRLLVFAHSDSGARSRRARYERSVPLHGVKLGETASGIRVSSYPAAAETFATRRGLTAELAPPREQGSPTPAYAPMGSIRKAGRAAPLQHRRRRSAGSWPEPEPR